MLALLLAVNIGFLVGLNFAKILAVIKDIRPVLNRLKLAEEAKEKEAGAVFVEPLSEAEITRREMEERIRSLNE